MGINPTRKSYGRVNRSYLVTETGVGDGIGCTLPKAAFENAPGVKDGLVPAGYPVTVAADGKAAPFAAGGELSGFTIDSVNVTLGDESIGYQWYGAIDPRKLPVAFDPAGATGNASKFYFGANVSPA